MLLHSAYLIVGLGDWGLRPILAQNHKPGYQNIAAEFPFAK